MRPSEIIDHAREWYQSLRLDELRIEGLHMDAELFYPAVTYPPLGKLPTQAQDDLLPVRGHLEDGAAAAYFHVPFCRSRCTFCHWVVSTGAGDDEKLRYLEAMEQEMVLHKRRLGLDRIPVRSVLVGGGTPTLLSPALLERFLASIHRHFDLSRCRQFSYEPEPRTVLGEQGEERLRILREHGVQRLSMGVQSFDDAVLKKLGRTHSAAEAREAIRRIVEAGFGSVSIDLIYGLPGQTMESWADTMLQAVASGAHAWQLYRLRVLPHGDLPGRIVDDYRREPSRFPEVADVLLLKSMGIQLSQAHGFDEHYTRIFARSPEHISTYLHDVNARLSDAVSVGVSSWSNYGRVFLNNTSDADQYYKWVAAGRIPYDRGLLRTDDDEMRRSLILPLKNDRVDRNRFRERTGADLDAVFGGPLQRLKERGMVEDWDGGVALTRRGRFCADEVAMLFYAPQYVPARSLESVNP